MATNNRRLKKILKAWSETDGYNISRELNRTLEEAWLANPGYELDPEMTKAIIDSRKTKGHSSND